MDDDWGDLPPIDAADDELELVGAAVRRALVQPVDAALAEAHVRLMVAARASAPPPGPFRTRPGPAPTPPRRLPRPAPFIAGLAAGGLVAAAVAAVFSLPGRGHHRATELSTPPPAVVTTGAPETTTVTDNVPTSAVPATVPVTAVVTTAAPPASVPASTSTTAATAPTTLAPPTTPRTEPPATTPSTTSSTAAGDACVNPVLVSITATLQPGGRYVTVVIRTTGTVPYMSVNISGIAGVTANLQPTAFGFQGTVTAPTVIPAGSVLEAGACGNRIRGTAVIQS